MKENNEDRNFLEFDILFDFDDHFIILDDFQISVISYISYLLASYLLFIKKKKDFRYSNSPSSKSKYLLKSFS